MSRLAKTRPPQRWELRATALLLAAGLALVGGCEVSGEMISGVTAHAVEFVAGPGAGFGMGEYPEIVEGEPEGGGEATGSTDVLSLGVGGTLVVDFPGFVLCDGDGPDLIVFENAFYVGGNPDLAYIEPAHVGAGEGVEEPFVEWPCEAELAPYAGCAGVSPVLANSTNGIDPGDPEQAGGDAFDLAEIGVESARYVRIRDAALADPMAGGSNLGADIDAVIAVHACIED